ncbi:peroxiredoxin [Haloquadratum walsbyi]|jgi:Peroxiredoxin|uniref:thioredoxin-dependent peroxiredoxin n=1 Tax=Haloquadratum walsbyi J07HQW2 TaxID=1238425 RepID=U1NJE0_9EURY|nr:peroxiredoxin [Haloquadratum walsbyi]ERG97053.1 MAG: peroxiredoxin [Haloquadratum walsbyi J07HQW2]
MLTSGDPAPTITATNQHDESVTVEFNTPTVVYFYPKDFTGGCTIEANDFQSVLPEFREIGIDVYGVSMDTVSSHAEFAEEENIIFNLLADPDGAIASRFGLDTSEGYVDRRTFTLADNEIISVYDPTVADPSGHAREVLTDMRNEYGRGG